MPTYYPPQGGAGYKANPPQGVRKGPVEAGPAPPPPPPPAEMPLFIYTLTETAFPSGSDMIPTETIVATPFLVAGDSENAINPTETIGDSVAVTETES